MSDEQEQKPSLVLPFGRSKSYRFSDAYSFTHAIASSSKTLLSFDAIEKKGKFNCAVSSLKVGNLDLVASIASPSRFAVKESQGLYLCFHYAGRAEAKVDGYRGLASADEFTFLSPEVQRTGESTSVSMVQLSLTEGDVLSVAETMFGCESFPAFKRALQRPRNIDLTGRNASVAAFLKGVFKQIDECALDAVLLQALGVDNLIYRIIATMVANDAGIDPCPNNAYSVVNGVVREVAEFIDANIAEDISLTDLERVSGIGARALQYAFLKSYGCSPMQWMRNRRLERIRENLLRAARDARIVEIALVCGWRNISSFAASYSERYGELPSDTVKRNGKSPSGIKM